MWIVFIKYALIPFILFCAALALYESGVLEFEAIFADAAGGVRYTDGLDGIFVMEET